MVKFKLMTLSKPILIYDGDCRFCRRWVERWREATEDRVDYAPYQEVAAQFPQIPEQTFKTSVHLVEPSGKIFHAAEAVFTALAAVPARRWPLWIYHHVPGARAISEGLYRLVARHRGFFSKITSALWGEDVHRSTYCLSSNIFTRLLGLIYLIAFVSLGTQILGLSGAQGIFPARIYLETVQSHAGGERFWFLPTLAWLSSTDFFLQFLCWTGATFSLFIIGGILEPVFLFLAWAFYLSLLGVCGPFLSFQWDILLLETGFLAIFFAPLALKTRCERPAFQSDTLRFLFKILLFKLMFFSGLVKLSSHDTVWRNLTALQYHFQTQPLPVWTSWYAHHLPLWLLKLSCVLMFGIELGVPFLVFFPRKLRHGAAITLIGFQALIFMTGNYNFFNLLTMLLCLLLIDDEAWPAYFRKKLTAASCPQKCSWPQPVPWIAALFIIGLYVGLFPAFRPFQMNNHYGLFAMMTTERPEIIVEGSNDGTTWLPYEFKYKPGDLNRAPRFVEPFQPRLDWQMWFAALGTWQHNRWFVYFCQRLLEGSPEVLKLLEKNPFSGPPPRYLRASVYEYRFTTPEEKKKTGAWWKREIKGLYCPVMSLKSSSPDR